MSNEIAKIYEQELTEQGLDDLRIKYPSDLVIDMGVDANFKDARKTRTERNKLTESLNRRRIDTTNTLKKMGDDLISSVDSIYSVVVAPFEIEDKRRKDEVDRIARENQKILDDDRIKINNLKGFIHQARIGDSAAVSGAIDAVTNIDLNSFHKDLIHEAMETKESVLNDLTIILSDTLAREQLDSERLELEQQRKEFEEVKNKASEPKITNSSLSKNAMTTEGMDYKIEILVHSTQSQFDRIFKDLKDQLSDNDLIVSVK